MCDAPSTWRASTWAMDCRSRSAAYNGLIAAPGTPKACVMPSFSITCTAAITAFIFAISRLLARRFVGDESSRRAAAIAVDQGQDSKKRRGLLRRVPFLFSNLDGGQ